MELQSMVAQSCKIKKIIIFLKHFANFVYIWITQEKVTIFAGISARKWQFFCSYNANIYKICKLCKALFSVFYRNLPPNIVTLVIL